MILRHIYQICFSLFQLFRLHLALKLAKSAKHKKSFEQKIYMGTIKRKFDVEFESVEVNAKKFTQKML